MLNENYVYPKILLILRYYETFSQTILDFCTKSTKFWIIGKVPPEFFSRTSTRTLAHANRLLNLNTVVSWVQMVSDEKWCLTALDFRDAKARKNEKKRMGIGRCGVEVGRTNGG